MREQPDLILVMTDQQRFDQWGGASDQHFETPAIDDLARRGVVFENAYSASTTCVPSRTALLTGIQPHRLPTADNGLALREGTWNVAHELRKAGYQTALVGKMHFHPSRAEHGFDLTRSCEHLFHTDFDADRTPHPDLHDDYHDWLVGSGFPDWRASPPPDASSADLAAAAFPFDASVHPTGWVAERACDVLAHRDPDRPIFLVVSFLHPHAPWNPPEPYVSKYDLADAVLPRDSFSANSNLPPGFLEDLAGGSGPYRPMRARSEKSMRWVLTLARALVNHIDRAIAQVLERVDQGRSVVFFTSDHGDYGGHRGLLQKVPWIPFEDLARVPLIVSAPDALEGTSVSSLVQSCDIPLTCLDYAGVEPPPVHFDSRSLRAHTSGAPQEEDLQRTMLCATTMGYPMIRRGNLKRIERRNWNGPDSLLFDLDRDPGETTDFAADPAYRERVFELAIGLKLEMERPAPDLPGFGARPSSGPTEAQEPDAAR
jgi:arylsulfatase